MLTGGSNRQRPDDSMQPRSGVPRREGPDLQSGRDRTLLMKFEQADRL